MNSLETKRYIEYKEKCEVRGIRSLTSFLALEEQEEILHICGKHVTVISAGGFNNAERVRFIIKPLEEDYIEDDFEIDVVKAAYDASYYTIEHKDILGTLISEGINRNQIGDILIKDGLIYIALTNTVSRLVVDDVRLIKRCKLKFEYTNDVVDKVDNFIERNIVVSSLRLDLIVKSLANLSREKAQQYIKDGNVKVANVECLDTSHLVKVNERITIRGYGKFFIKEIVASTKKDNLVLLVAKYN